MLRAVDLGGHYVGKDSVIESAIYELWKFVQTAWMNVQCCYVAVSFSNRS